MRAIKLLPGALLALSAVAASANSLNYESVWSCDSSKFNWYCDEEEQAAASPRAKPVPAPAPAKQTAPKPARIDVKDMKTAEQMRAELKRREDIAVMDPSNANLRDYLELWQVVQDKGSVFADNWRRVVWTNPDLDYTLKRPANNSAIKVFDDQRDQAQDRYLEALGKEHGLIFFFRSDCPYCHAMAPTLKMLSDRYGIEILAVSVDGAGLPQFPNFRDGRAQAAKWNIERVPALFIGSKKSGEHAPVGFGIMSVSEIVNRIFVLTNTKPGEQF